MPPGERRKSNTAKDILENALTNPESMDGLRQFLDKENKPPVLKIGEEIEVDFTDSIGRKRTAKGIIHNFNDKYITLKFTENVKVEKKFPAVPKGKGMIRAVARTDIMGQIRKIEPKEISPDKLNAIITPADADNLPKDTEKEKPLEPEIKEKTLPDITDEYLGEMSKPFIPSKEPEAETPEPEVGDTPSDHTPTEADIEAAREISSEEKKAADVETARAKAKIIENFSQEYLENLKNKVLENITEPDERKGVLKWLDRFKKFWKKSFLFRMGVGLGLAGVGIFGIGSAATGSLVVSGVLAFRITSNLIGNALTHNTATEAMDETRHLRKQAEIGRISMAKAVIDCGKTFFKKLREKGFKKGWKEAGQAVSEKFREKTFLTEEVLISELEKILDPNDKLKYIEDKLIGTYEIARRKGVKITEIAGAETIQNVLLKKLEQTLPEAIERSLTGANIDIYGDIYSKIASGKELTNEEKTKAVNLIENKLHLSTRLTELLETTQKTEDKHAQNRLIRSIVYGGLATALTFGLPALWKKLAQKTPPKSETIATAGAGAATESTSAREAIAPPTQLDTCYGKTEIITTADGKEEAEIFGRLYRIVEEEGEKKIRVPLDLTYNGEADIGPDGIEMVSIDPETGFGTFKEEIKNEAGKMIKTIEHVVRADDKDFEKNLYGLIARRGQMVDLNKDRIYDAQVWKDNGQWRASYMNKILPPGAGKIDPAEFVFDDTNTIKPDYLENLKDTDIPKNVQDVFGNKFEFDHFIAEGNTPTEKAKDLARQWEIFQNINSPYDVSQEKIDKLAELIENTKSINFENVKPDNVILKNLYNSETVKKATESGKSLIENIYGGKMTFTQTAKVFIKKVLFHRYPSHSLVTGNERNSLFSIIKNDFSKIIKNIDQSQQSQNIKDIHKELLANCIKNPDKHVLFSTPDGGIDIVNIATDNPDKIAATNIAIGKLNPLK